PIEATIRLTAASGGSGHEHAAGAGDGAPDTDARARTVAIAVTDGKVEPPPGRVELKRGERVRLRVTSDQADTLHVHGYDKEAELPAGKTATLTFTADRTGLFEVETHGSGLVLTQLVVR
ncbi:cupredoxin domain-containing protein, partial [Streptomyces boluensis]